MRSCQVRFSCSFANAPAANAGAIIGSIIWGNWTYRPAFTLGKLTATYVSATITAAQMAKHCRGFRRTKLFRNSFPKTGLAIIFTYTTKLLNRQGVKTAKKRQSGRAEEQFTNP